jgi:hypothetical protein
LSKGFEQHGGQKTKESQRIGLVKPGTIRIFKNEKRLNEATLQFLKIVKNVCSSGEIDAPLLAL